MPLFFPDEQVYQNQNFQTQVRFWSGVATTTSGVATFNPTEDNTASGTALFSTFYAVVATAHVNTASINGVPLCGTKSIAGDKKTVTVNVINVTTIGLLGGNAGAFAADGTEVQLIIVGNV